MHVDEQLMYSSSLQFLGQAVKQPGNGLISLLLPVG